MVVYLITNTINGRRYIGKTTQSVSARWRQHRHDASHGSDTYLHRAMRKYGIDAFTIETIDTAVDADELETKERRWIAEHNSIHNGYNMTPGGDGGSFRHTPETRAKMSRTRKGKRHTPVHCAAISAAKIGGTRSDAHKASISASLTGVTHSRERRANQSRAMMGRVVSAETRRRISEAKRAAFKVKPYQRAA